MKNIKYISASAGSGKTYRLTQELTNAIKSGAVEPENVILTTFTKAAASEFKEKASVDQTLAVSKLEAAKDKEIAELRETLAKVESKKDGEINKLSGNIEIIKKEHLL